jgi:hypothetical protein
MACSSCQQNNHVVPTVTSTTNHSTCECACGCSEPACPTPQPCTEITDSKCIIYTDAPIKCGNDVVVTTNASVSTALNQITNFFCDLAGLVTTADILCGDTIIVPAGSSVQAAFELTVQFICNIQLTPGPQGPAGLQGPAGAQGPVGATGPTPWTLPATVYNNGFAYPLGAAVIYQGGYYYRTGNPLNPGYPPTPGSINASWTPVADGGAEGPVGPQGPIGLTGATGPQGPIGLTGPAGAAGLYSQTRSSTPVTNATGMASLIGLGSGTLSVPANAFQVGDSFKATLHGQVTCANNQQLRVVIFSNGNILATTPLIVLPQITGKHWTLEIDFVIRAIGGPATAVIMTGGNFIYNKDSNNVYEGVGFRFEQATLFDTTVLNTLTIEAEWGTVNAANSIYSEIFNLFKTF